jgi:hypothetical protein
MVNWFLHSHVIALWIDKVNLRILTATTNSAMVPGFFPDGGAMDILHTS